jgi:glucosylceramidase
MKSYNSYAGTVCLFSLFGFCVDQSNNSLQDYAAYANYLADFVMQYRSDFGINISYLTVQNEPGNTSATTSPGMVMSGAQESSFINDDLDNALSGLSTQILGYDWNWGDAQGWGLTGLLKSTPVAGTAWHCYDGTVSSQLSFSHSPGESDFITECSGHTNAAATPPSTSYPYSPPTVDADNAANFAGNLNWDSRNLVTGGLDNWASGVQFFNLALDNRCGPQLPSPGYPEGAPGCIKSPPNSSQCRSCRGIVTVLGSTVNYNVEYWVLVQAAAAFGPGMDDIRVEVGAGSWCSSSLCAAAGVNPEDGSLGLYVSNQSSTPQTFTVDAAGEGFSYTLPASSVASFRW